ncbi:MAG: response regulator transcription factor [Bacteroidota bacterium]
MKAGILVYEDNTSLRESISGLISLSENFSLLEQFSDAQAVERQVKFHRPDVILMDIDMPGTNGIEAVKQIRRFNRDVAIIMLTVFQDSQHVYDAICAGASGYLLKKHISEKLTSAILEVLEGGAPMSPGIAKMVIQHLQNFSPEANKYNLTAREKDILTSLSKGNSFKLIAAELIISIDTVRTHIKNIYEKLQVHSQIEAVSKAVSERLV